MEISILLSVLSAVTTAIWTVWTWGEQKNLEREERRERLAASYVNPFLLAAEALRYRLYYLLQEENTRRPSNWLENTSGFASPFTVETLYRFALYFGWETYLFRYSPYTNDPRSMELSREVVRGFVDLESFPDESFRFSLSEQLALGNVVVKPISSRDSEFLLLTSIDLYQFEEELLASHERGSPLAASPGVRAAIESLERFCSNEPWEGRQRLEAIVGHLAELIEYLEKEEGFSVALQEERRPIARKAEAATTEVVHRTPGRVRLRVPRTRFDEQYAEQLRERVLSLAGVTEASVNPPCASLTVHYTPSPSGEDWSAFLVGFIDRQQTREGP